MKHANRHQRTVTRRTTPYLGSRFAGYGILASASLLLVCFVSVRLADAMGGRVPTHSGYFVRVAIVPETASLLLHVPGSYRLRGTSSSPVLHEGRGLYSVEVVPTSDGLRVGHFVIPGTGLHVETARDGIITVNGQRVRGQLNILRLDDTRLRVINRVDLEDYLASVLVREVPARWPMEVLKAQAIAARTYAVFQAAQRTSYDFDVTGDVSSQVYGGRSAERRRTNQAVDATRGQILAYQGQIFPAFFHAACGGHTEAARALWAIDLPPLAGRPCPFDQHSPYATWTGRVSLDHLAQQLRTEGVHVGRLERVEATAWTSSGRLQRVRLVGSQDSHTMSAKDFRMLVGVNVMKSTLVSLAVQEGELILSGRGWGHGVGLCQWGAFGMAQAGYAAADIVQYYYPGAEIRSLPPVESLAAP